MGGDKKAVKNHCLDSIAVIMPRGAILGKGEL